MGRILMRPQHLATLYRCGNSSDATPPQAGQLCGKTYLFKRLQRILHVGHIPVVRAAQRGRDWQDVQTHLGDRSRRNRWKTSLKLSQHLAFWPLWRPVTKVGSSKTMSHPSPLWPRSQSNLCSQANTTEHGRLLHGSGRGTALALTPVACAKGGN